MFFEKPIRVFALIAVLFFAFIGVVVQPKAPVVTSTNISELVVPNSSVERVSTQTKMPAAWHSESWGANKAIFTYLPSGHTGKRSLKVTITNYKDGDAKWYFDTQRVISGKQYTFKDYYQSNVLSRVVVKFEKKDGTFLYRELETASASGSWTQYQASFTAPKDAINVTVLHLLATNGFLITDDYQITDYTPVGFKRGIVSITWDDGAESQYTKAFPLHKQYDLPGTFFLTSGLLDTKFFMTTQQALQLQSAGHELGSHTVTHPHVPSLSYLDQNYELTQSQSDLQTKFGTSFKNFATPYGDYNDQVMSLIKKNYRSHRSVEEGYNAKDTFNIHNIVVQNVLTTTTPDQVKEWINKAKTDKTWLVLVYHQVDNPGDSYSITSSNLDTEFSYLKKSGIQVLTVDDALVELLPQIDK